MNTDSILFAILAILLAALALLLAIATARMGNPALNPSAHWSRPLLMLVILAIAALAIWCGGRATGLLRPSPPRRWSPMHEHKPTNVSDIGQIGNDPDSFAAGREALYYSALEPGAGPPVPHIYKCVPGAPTDPCVVTRITALSEKARSIAVVPGLVERLLFFTGEQLRFWDGSLQTAVPTGETAGHLLAVRADWGPGVMLANPPAQTNQIQLYSIDTRTRPPSYTPVGNPVTGAEVVAFELSLVPGQRAAFTARDTGGIVRLYLWTGSGTDTPTAQPEAEPCHLVASEGIRYLYAAKPAQYWRPLAIEGGRVVPLAENVNLDQILSITSWDSRDWVLGTIGQDTTLWRIDDGKLNPVEPLGRIHGPAQYVPRSLVPLGATLGFVSGTMRCWNVAEGLDYDSTRGTGMELIAPDATISGLWPFRSQAFFAAKHITAGVGVKLFRWWGELPHR